MTEKINDNYYISIHASHAGRDYTANILPTVSAEFQSTRPMRDATRLLFRVLAMIRFQSTRPMRDATKLRRDIQTADIFQSTRPMRDATSAYVSVV